MIYLLWAILPITLFLMALWAFLKPYLKVYGKEEGKRYFVMAVICSAVLYIAIQFDKTEFAKEIVKKISLGKVDYSMVRLFVYPAFLYVGSVLWDFYDKKKK